MDASDPVEMLVTQLSTLASLDVIPRTALMIALMIHSHARMRVTNNVVIEWNKCSVTILPTASRPPQRNHHSSNNVIVGLYKISIRLNTKYYD